MEKTIDNYTTTILKITTAFTTFYVDVTFDTGGFSVSN